MNSGTLELFLNKHEAAVLLSALEYCKRSLPWGEPDQLLVYELYDKVWSESNAQLDTSHPIFFKEDRDAVS